MGVLTVGCVTKVSLDSFHAKISNYQVYIDSVVSKKRKFGVSKTKPAPVLEKAIQVVGGRVTGSCTSNPMERLLHSQGERG